MQTTISAKNSALTAYKNAVSGVKSLFSPVAVAA